MNIIASIAFLSFIGFMPGVLAQENQPAQQEQDGSGNQSASNNQEASQSSIAENSVDISFASLMFLPEDIEYIRKAEKSRETKVPIEILLPELFGRQVAGENNLPQTPRPTTTGSIELPPQTQEPIVYSEPDPVINPADTPIVLLKSILYLSSNNWTVWIEDQKISSQDEDYQIVEEKYGKFDLIKVEPKRVIAIWEDFPSKMIDDVSETSVHEIDEDIYASEDYQLIYDTKNKKLIFILEPNQAVVPYLLRIIEGKGNAGRALSDKTKAVPNNQDQDIAQENDQQPLEKVKPAAIPANDMTAAKNKNMENYMKQIKLLQNILSQVN